MGDTLSKPNDRGDEAALVETEGALKAALLAFIKRPLQEEEQALMRLMIRYQTIYELCELP